MDVRQDRAAGIEALRLATQLLRRVRLADPRAGIWEAADLQWWWRTPRRSDALDQLFWFDGDEPIAAALLTDWDRAWGLDPIILPDAPAGLQALVSSAATRRLDELFLGDVEAVVRDDDKPLATWLRSSGFEATDHHGALTWMDAAERPPVPAVPDGFVLVDRLRSRDRTHPLAVRNGPTVEVRLNQVDLYDPELDLAIRAPTGAVAAYALFWFDPVTRVGLVEPMRTEDRWQRRGLGRVLLTAGLDRLADKGATRLKVSFGTMAAREFYVGAGFRVDAAMTTYIRRTASR